MSGDLIAGNTIIANLLPIDLPCIIDEDNWLLLLL